MLTPEIPSVDNFSKKWRDKVVRIQCYSSIAAQVHLWLFSNLLGIPAEKLVEFEIKVFLTLIFSLMSLSFQRRHETTIRLINIHPSLMGQWGDHLKGSEDCSVFTEQWSNKLLKKTETSCTPMYILHTDLRESWETGAETPPWPFVSPKLICTHT